MLLLLPHIPNWYTWIWLPRSCFRRFPSKSRCWNLSPWQHGHPKPYDPTKLPKSQRVSRLLCNPLLSPCHWIKSENLCLVNPDKTLTVSPSNPVELLDYPFPKESGKHRGEENFAKTRAFGKPSYHDRRAFSSENVD